MKKILFVILFVPFISIGQISFKVSDDTYSPDITVKIGSDVYYPDISIKIGSDVYSSDFSVGISSNRYQADFIITDGFNADFTVKASNDVYYPDLSIKASDDVYYPDITIKLVKSGTVDYVIYNEKNYTSMADIISALLPVIHKYTDYQTAYKFMNGVVIILSSILTLFEALKNIIDMERFNEFSKTIFILS